MSAGHHTIRYIEFTVRDLQAAKRFYAAAFGWQFNDYGPEYAGIQGADGEVGGFHQSSENRTTGPASRFSIPTTSSRRLRRYGRPAARYSASRSRFPAAGDSTSRIPAATSSRSGRLLDRPSGDGVLWPRVNLEQVRRLALSLPEASEKPHFHLASFRVNGKIFATLAPDGSYLNVFVDDTLREVMAAVDPHAYETLWRGESAYLHVHVGAAKAKDVQTLLQASWERKAPKKLLSQSK